MLGILALGLSACQISGHYRTLFDRYYAPFQGENAIILQKSLAKAWDLYQAEEFEATAEACAQVLADNPENMLAHFYLGLAHLGMEHDKPAIENLSFVTERESPQLSLPSIWYLGLAHLRAGNTRSAGNCFSKLVKHQNIYEARSRRILEALDQVNMAPAKLPLKETKEILLSPVGANLRRSSAAAVSALKLGMYDEISIRYLASTRTLYLENNLKQSQDLVVRIYNAEGQLVHLEKKRGLKQGESLKINMEYFPSGNYRLRLQLGNGDIITSKFDLPEPL